MKNVRKLGRSVILSGKLMEISQRKPSIGILRDSEEEEDLKAYAAPRVEAIGEYLVT